MAERVTVNPVVAAREAKGKQTQGDDTGRENGCAKPTPLPTPPPAASSTPAARPKFKPTPPPVPRPSPGTPPNLRTPLRVTIPPSGFEAGATDVSTSAESSPRSSPPAVAARCSREFLLASCLQLLDRQADTDRGLLELVPALHSLLAVAGTKVPPAVASTVESWLAGQQNRRLGANTSTVLCGWLRKSSSKMLASKKRWVVLDGTTLLYYADRAETDLKGILHLYGCQSRAVRSLVDRGYHFEVVAPQPSKKPDKPPAAGSSTPSSPSEVSPLNPMHTSKTMYHWVATTAEDRDRWMCAIQRAAGMPHHEGVALQWAKRFHDAPSVGAYRGNLRALAARSAHLRMSADWVRMQVQEVVAPGVDVTSPAKARKREELREQAARAAATALVSSQKRTMGYALGDRVSLHQLQQDVQRDRVRIEGTLLTSADVADVVTCLTGAIVAKLDEKELAPCPRAGASASCFAQGRILEFAHEVAKCSSRTVAGGDSYFALQLVFGHRDLVLLKQASTDAPPVDVLVDWAHTLDMGEVEAAAVEAGAGLPASVGGSSHSRQPSGASNDTSVLEFGSPASVRSALSSLPSHMVLGSPMTPGSPRRANAFAGAKGAVPDASPRPVTAPPPTAPAELAEPPQDVPFVSDQGPLCVKVVTSQRYVVCSSDIGDDGAAPPWAYVVAEFSRTFAINASPSPGVIHLRLDAVPGDVGEEGEAGAASPAM